MRLLSVALAVLRRHRLPPRWPDASRPRKPARRTRLGWDYMRAEAVRESRHGVSAIDRDRSGFEMSFVWPRPRHLALKQFVSATSALSRCRDLYSRKPAGKFTNQQEAQRYRHDRLIEIDEMIRQLQSGPQTLARQDQLRQLQEHARQIQEYVTRGNNMTIASASPHGCRCRSAARISVRANLRMPNANTRPRSPPIAARAKRTTTSPSCISKRNVSPSAAIDQCREEDGLQSESGARESDSRESQIELDVLAIHPSNWYQ